MKLKKLKQKELHFKPYRILSRTYKNTEDIAVSSGYSFFPPSVILYRLCYKTLVQFHSIPNRIISQIQLSQHTQCASAVTSYSWCRMMRRSIFGTYIVSYWPGVLTADPHPIMSEAAQRVERTREQPGRTLARAGRQTEHTVLLQSHCSWVKNDPFSVLGGIKKAVVRPASPHSPQNWVPSGDCPSLKEVF